MRNRILSTLLTMCMLASLMPSAALAENYDEQISEEVIYKEEILTDAEEYKEVGEAPDEELVVAEDCAEEFDFLTTENASDLNADLFRENEPAEDVTEAESEPEEAATEDLYIYNSEPECISEEPETVWTEEITMEDLWAEENESADEFDDVPGGSVLSAVPTEEQPAVIDKEHGNAELAAGAVSAGTAAVAGAVQVDPLPSGCCGDLVWFFDNGTLYLSGNGQMSDVYFAGLVSPDEITEVDFLDSNVTNIGGYAFADCVKLKNITLPGSVKSIGDEAFSGCTGLTKISIPAGVTSIGHKAFSNCTGLTECSFPESVTNIGSNSFSGCSSLTSVTIRSSRATVGEGAFYNCAGLKNAGPFGSGCSIQFGWNEVIPNAAFSGSNITAVTIPSSVKSIGEWAFADCVNLVTVTIPSGVTSIGVGAFYGCSSLTGVVIPASVTSMGALVYDGEGCFSACSRLTTAGPIGSGCNIQFGWTDTIPAYAFHECRSLTSISIPNGITCIGDRAFEDCENLQTIRLPDSVKTIGDGAFAYCTRLIDVNIPYGVEELLPYFYFDFNHDKEFFIRGLFENCVSLRQITIPTSVNCIGTYIFTGCTGLTCITIPGSVTSIGQEAFNNCTGLTAVSLTKNLTTIWDDAFKGCASLKTVSFQGSKNDWNAITIRDGNEALTRAAVTFSELLLSQPVISSVSNVKTGVKIAWEAVADAETYCVYRKGPSDPDWQKVGETSSTAYTDQTAKSGSKYSYKVSALAMLNGKTVSSAASAVKSITCVAVPTISSIKNARTGVTIKWKAVSGAARYQIYRKTGSGNWKKLAVTEKTSYTDKTVQSGTKYSYRIRCINSKDKPVNTYSATKSITFYAPPVIRSTTAAKGKVVVTWDKVSGAKRYNVYRKTGSGKYVLIREGVTKTGFTDKKVKKGKKYSYEITVANSSGKSLSVFSKPGRTVEAK